jgi:hypothetical protein
MGTRTRLCLVIVRSLWVSTIVLHGDQCRWSWSCYHELFTPKTSKCEKYMYVAPSPGRDSNFVCGVSAVEDLEHGSFSFKKIRRGKFYMYPKEAPLSDVNITVGE